MGAFHEIKASEAFANDSGCDTSCLHMLHPHSAAVEHSKAGWYQTQLSLKGLVQYRHIQCTKRL